MKQVFDEKDVIDFSQYEQETNHKVTVKPASVYVDSIIDDIRNPKPVRHHYMPWKKTRGLLQFRPGEVSLWGGENGTGKSLITGQVALYLAGLDQKVTLASFEMKPIRTLGRMGRQWTGFDARDAFIRGDEREKAKLIDLYEQYRDWTKDRIWLYDKQGSVSWRNVVAMVRYAAQELGSSHIFVDNLMKCVAGEDDYNGQKEFVDALTAAARDYDIHAHIIHHVKKPAKEGEKPNKYSVKGTGAITDQVDNVLLVWRNKAKEHSAPASRSKSDPDSLLIVDKQRNGEGWEGQIALWYEPKSQQYLGSFDDKPMEFFNPQEDFRE